MIMNRQEVALTRAKVCHRSETNFQILSLQNSMAGHINDVTWFTQQNKSLFRIEIVVNITYLAGYCS